MGAKGHGVIGMKIIGNGDFTKPEDREKSIRFAMQSGLVDAVVIGFKTTVEINEAIRRIDASLANSETDTFHFSEMNELPPYFGSTLNSFRTTFVSQGPYVGIVESNTHVIVVPEPCSIGLLIVGLFGMPFVHRIMLSNCLIL